MAFKFASVKFSLKAFVYLVGILMIVLFTLYLSQVEIEWTPVLYRERKIIGNISVDPGNAESRSTLSSSTSQANCSHTIVFAKTHKTAGSTIGSIVARFGFEKHLSFALPKAGRIIIGTSQFQREMLLAPTTPDGKGFDIFFNHVPFNKSSISKVMMPSPKFFTILRDPVTQFYSAINFFGFHRYLKKANSSIEQLLRHIEYCDSYVCHVVYNGQAFDLGVFEGGPHKRYSSRDIDGMVKQVDRDFDLVMLQEYLDESLILLKRLMCWNFEDILYLPKKARSHGSAPSETVREMIYHWNYIDRALHRHFNETLWKQIKNFGPDFQSELEHFRKLLSEISTVCNGLPSNVSDDSILKLKELGTSCENLQRDVLPYTGMFRRKAINGIVQKGKRGETEQKEPTPPSQKS